MIIQNKKVFESAKAQFEKYLTDKDIKRINETIYKIVKDME